MPTRIRPHAIEQNTDYFVMPNLYIGTGPYPASVNGLFVDGASGRLIQCPVMTTTQRDAVSSPQNGMIVWNSTTGQLEEYDGAWKAVGADALNAHLADTLDAHDASAISNVPAGSIAAINVQTALDELDTEKAALASAVMDGDAAGGVLSGTYPDPSFAADMATQAELDAHLTDTIDAHDASAISNVAAGGIVATDVQAAINEIDATIGTGWQDAGETWTYVSATTFTVPGDVTAKYTIGTKLMLTQTTVKYFHVLSSSYGAPNTTVTVVTQTDYTLANAAITSPFYSRADLPVGFPDWFNWTATITGFSANPTNLVHKFRISGRTVHLVVRHATAGTSNATDYTVSLPTTAAAVNNAAWFSAIPALSNNSVNLTTPGRALILSGGTIVTCGPNSASSTWVASGTKNVAFSIVYEI